MVFEKFIVLLQVYYSYELMKRLALLLWLCLFLLHYVAVGQNYTMSNGTFNINCQTTHHFYDPGGPNGNYGNYLYIVQTFVAPEGQCLQVTFSSFSTESCCDYLKIYDGTNTSGYCYGEFKGSNTPGSITSISGALTFVFSSDNSVTRAGWNATISCAECSPSGCIPQSTANGSPCSQQTMARPFCTGENPYGVTFPSGLSGEAEVFFHGADEISCLQSASCPAWYYMQIDQPGDMLIYIQQFDNYGNDMDVDFACWGPFTATSQADFLDRLCCGQLVLQNTYSANANVNGSFVGSHRPPSGNHSNGNTGGYPVGNVIDCSWSSYSTEWCFIPNTQTGQWYILLISNWEETAGTITFSLVESSSNATTNCTLLAPITSNSPVCEGDSLILTCEHPIAGATYNWAGPNGWADTTQVPTVSIPDVTTDYSGQFSLQITGAGQSVDVSTVDVTIVASPVMSISANHDTICSGTSVTLTAMGAGTSSQNYHWTPGNTHGRIKNVIPTTTVDTCYIYTVTGTSGGCYGTASDTIWVFPNPSVSITVVPENATLCQGDTAMLYASGGESYKWRLYHDITIISLDDSLRVVPSASTTYQVIASSAAGCTKTDTLSLTVHAIPVFHIEGADSVCLGDSVLLTASSDELDDAYLWNTGEYTRSIRVAPTETNDYELVITNREGCSSLDVKQVAVFPTAIWLYRDTLCWNEPYQDANFNTQGTLVPGNYRYDTLYQTVASCDSLVVLELVVLPMEYVSQHETACGDYQWRGKTYTQSGIYCDSLYNERGCLQVDTLHLTVYHVTPVVERVIVCEPYTWHGFQHSVSGTHLYNYMDEHNCPCVDTLHLTITTRPELVLATVMNATCNQDNGYIKIESSEGLPPYSYVYLPSGEEAYFEGLSAGAYHLQMIDSIGCTDDEEFHIDHIIHRVELVSVTDAHCGRADGGARISASGGYGEFTYQWSSPVVSTTNMADHLTAGLYAVSVVDSNGCSLSLEFRVKDIPGPDACFTFSTFNEQQVTFVNCTSQDVTSWFWSFGDGHTSIEWQPSHKYVDPGEYPVVLTVEDDNQCVDSLSLVYVIREVSGIYLPSAFIPESDVVENRVFKPYGNSISATSYEMTIYDRWGQLIFVSRHPDEGWDGRINGTLAPQGNYSYQIKYQDLDGKPGSTYGTVILLRGS